MMYDNFRSFGYMYNGKIKRKCSKKYKKRHTSEAILEMKPTFCIQQFCCGSLLPIFGVRFGDVSPIVFAVRFRLLSGHLLGKKLPIRLTICYFCILTICNHSYFPFLFFWRGFGF